jgi:hypothetical protein
MRRAKNSSPPLFDLRNSQIGKISIRVASGPKGHFAAKLSKFEIVDNEAGLIGSVDVKFRQRARHDDAKSGPYTRLKIRIGFVRPGVSARVRSKGKSGTGMY